MAHCIFTFPVGGKTVSHAVLPRPVVQKHTVSMCHGLSAAQQDYIC